MALSIRSATSSVAVALSLLVVQPRLALADDNPSANTSKEQRAEAKNHFKRGLAHQQAGAYAEAVAEYQAAYAITPLADLLFNIAQCHRLGGQRDQALFYYRRYLEQVPEGGASDDAKAHITALEAQPKTETPKVHPPEPRPTVIPPSNESAADDESDGSSTWRWVGIGGVAVGVVGLGLGAWQAVESSNAESDVESGGVFDPVRDQEGKDARQRALIFGGVGAALVVGGGLTWYFAGNKTESERRVSALPVLAPGLAGLSFSGRF